MSLSSIIKGLDPSSGDWLTDDELHNLETNGTAWAQHFWPKRFARDFTGYQTNFYKFVTTLEPDRPNQPRIECEPRGVGKSTNGRTAAVYLLARKLKFYVLIVSATAAQSKKHFAAMKKQLEAPALLAHYPHLRPKVSTHRNSLTNWSSDRLVTEAGQVVEFISVLGNARGFNTEEGMRLDLILLDDVDDQKDSVDVTEKKLEIIGSNILGAGDEKTDIIFLQNLIHRTSICTRLRDNTAGILNNRHFVGPFPLCRRYSYVEETIEGDTTGAKHFVVTDFQPYDPVTSKEYVEILLNRLGPKRFERECQQNLTLVDEDKDFREYSEIHHVITYSEFYTYWKRYGVPIVNERRQTLQIPSQWNVGLGQDWGTTADHPASIAPVARPNQAVPLHDSFFVFGEVVMPEYPHDVNSTPDLVSPGRVAAAEKKHLKHWNVAEAQITLRRMSHEASAALNSFALDLSEDLKVYYSKWKAQKGSGVPQIQNVLEIDYRLTHPFRRFPNDHPDPAKKGQPIMGRPKFFIIVPDDQGMLRCDEVGNLFVAQPFNSAGCARLRGEFPIYSHRNQGKKKIFDDMIDALRGIMGSMLILSGELNEDQRYRQTLELTAPELLPENIAKITDPVERSLVHATERIARHDFMEAERRGTFVKDDGLFDYLREGDQEDAWEL